jgi:hypothetical protein
MKADQEEMLTKMEASIEDENEKFELLRNTLVSRMDAHHGGMMACLGKTEVTDLEANPEEMQSEAVNSEVPKEDAVVETGRAPNKRQRDRHLAEKHR